MEQGPGHKCPLLRGQGNVAITQLLSNLIILRPRELGLLLRKWNQSSLQTGH
jgi:hypothetical protein